MSYNQTVASSCVVLLSTRNSPFRGCRRAVCWGLLVFMRDPGLFFGGGGILQWHGCLHRAAAGDFRAPDFVGGNPSRLSGAPQGNAIAFVLRFVVATLEAGGQNSAKWRPSAQELSVDLLFDLDQVAAQCVI